MYFLKVPFPNNKNMHFIHHSNNRHKNVVTTLLTLTYIQLKIFGLIYQKNNIKQKLQVFEVFIHLKRN